MYPCALVQDMAVTCICAVRGYNHTPAVSPWRPVGADLLHRTGGHAGTHAAARTSVLYTRGGGSSPQLTTGMHDCAIVSVCFTVKVTSVTP